MRATRLPGDPRRVVHGIVRRHRRPIAAALAGLAMLLALSSVRGTVSTAESTTPGTPPVTSDPTAFRDGEVGVPVTLASGAVASVLDVGDVIDLIAVGEDGRTRVVASSARIVERAATGGGLSASGGGMVVVAVPASAGPDVAVAGVEDTVVVVLRSSEVRDS